jgi:peptidyl-prolyl cis-trans isomerase C
MSRARLLAHATTQPVASWSAASILRKIIAVLAVATRSVLASGGCSACDMLCCAEAAERTKVAVAIVDGQPVYAAEAQRVLKQVLGPQQADPAALPVIQAQVLAEIINRRLVLAYARRRGEAATAAEIDSALSELGKRLQAAGSSLKEYLDAQSLEEADLRRQLAWRITWNRLLRKYVTQQRMEDYFAQHRRHLDGTELCVSHILLTTKPGDNPPDISELIKQAAQLRAEILAGKLSFEEAAQRYSSSPTARDAGRLGYIRRDGPMVEAFTRAAFALQPGEISQPVVTSFGVHLIRCDAVKPGDKKFADVLQQIEDGLARQLLEELAAQQSRHSTVEYTGAWPHFKPGTTELAPQR